jgi:hypothetical protein
MPDLAISKETLDEAIDRAKAAGADLIVDVKKAIDGSATIALGQVKAVIHEALTFAAEIVDSLDGYTATITIPQITIKLHKEQPK